MKTKQQKGVLNGNETCLFKSNAGSEIDLELKLAALGVPPYKLREERLAFPSFTYVRYVSLL